LVVWRGVWRGNGAAERSRSLMKEGERRAARAKLTSVVLIFGHPCTLEAARSTAFLCVGKRVVVGLDSSPPGSEFGSVFVLARSFLVSGACTAVFCAKRGCLQLTWQLLHPHDVGSSLTVTQALNHLTSGAAAQSSGTVPSRIAHGPSSVDSVRLTLARPSSTRGAPTWTRPSHPRPTTTKPEPD
jgi:hypothetical protein